MIANDGGKDPNLNPRTKIDKNTQERYTFAVGEPSYSNSDQPTNEPPGGPMTGLKDFAKDGHKEKKDKKEVSVDILSKDDLLASFSCDVAKTFQDKVAGLQTYDSLSQNAGLVFEYKKPEDVVYHMGTVKFPIDIIFADDNNKIKKIYRDIKPGTLATFGCANVKNVLEICGGLSDRLGISEGNTIVISDGVKKSLASSDSRDLPINKNTIIKYSNYSADAIFNWNGFPIVNINNSLTKRASSSSSSPVSNLVKLFRPTRKKIALFDFDGVLSSLSTIRLFKVTSSNNNSETYLKFGGGAVGIDTDSSGSQIFKDASVKEVLSSKVDSKFAILDNKSFKNFLSDSESLKILSSLRNAIHKKDTDAYIITRYANSKLLSDLIFSKYSQMYGEYPVLKIERVPAEHGPSKIISSFKKKFGNQDCSIYTDRNIFKRAGIPIPQEDKDIAESILGFCSQVVDDLEVLIENLRDNSSEYNRFTSKPDFIKTTKGEYKRSSDRNAEIFEKILNNTKVIVQKFMKIEDIETTGIIMNSITESSLACSDGLTDIFNLIHELDNQDFVNKITDKTTKYEKLVEDFKLSIENAERYIEVDILGLEIISKP